MQVHMLQGWQREVKCERFIQVAPVSISECRLSLLFPTQCLPEQLTSAWTCRVIPVGENSSKVTSGLQLELGLSLPWKSSIRM